MRGQRHRTAGRNLPDAREGGEGVKQITAALREPNAYAHDHSEPSYVSLAAGGKG